MSVSQKAKSQPPAAPPLGLGAPWGLSGLVFPTAVFLGGVVLASLLSPLGLAKSEWGHC